MSKEIVVNKGKQTRIAIVENGELAELFIENQEHERTIGNIFLGKVRRIMPSIQAAFVDIGQKQDAFLHFSDLIENVEDWISYASSDTPVIGKFEANYTTRPTKKKRRHPSGSSAGRNSEDADDGEDEEDRSHLSAGRLKDQRKSAHGRQHGRHDGRLRDRDSEDTPYVDPTTILKKDQPILVKISKEPIANKGSRITTDISLAGRFLVLVPMANYVAVSKKILSFKERRRLRALARSLLPEGFGVIVRTVADGRSAKALDTDLNLLIEKWKSLEEKLLPGPKAPVVVHEDVNMVSSIMRDLFTEDYDHIVLDDQRLYRNIKGYVQAIAPDMVANVKFHPGPQSIFEKAGIKEAVEEAFDSRVNLPSGGYLFVETTEAMHVIDVNSGRAGRGLSQEENSLRVNLEAARVLSKQVRLRDLGGIIVVDFIDMRNERNRRKVYESLKTEFRKDRAVTKVLPMSDFGLIQITRQRLRPSITKTFSLPEGTEATPRNWNERTPTAVKVATSSEQLAAPDDFREAVEKWLEAFKASGRTGKVKLVLHPFAAAFFKGGFFTQTMRWIFKFGVRVELAEDSTIDPLTFRFFEMKTGKDITILPKITEKKREDRQSKPEVKAPRNDTKEVPSGRSQSRDASSSSRGQDSNRGPRNERSSRGENADRRDSRRDRGQRNEGSQRPERSQADQRSKGDQRRQNSRDDREESNSRSNQGRSSRGPDQRQQHTGRTDVASAADDSTERETELKTRGGQGRSEKNRSSMSRGRTPRSRDEGQLVEGGITAEDGMKETAPDSNAERDSNSSAGKKKPRTSVASKRKTAAKPKRTTKSKSDDSTVSKADMVPEDLFSTVEAELETAPSTEENKPKKRSSTPKKAGTKRVPAKTKVSSENKVTSPNKSAAVEVSVSKKKPSSAPTRHRLEKYDFSQAALAKAPRKVAPTETGGDDAGSSN